jgi:hypothetical protein
MHPSPEPAVNDLELKLDTCRFTTATPGESPGEQLRTRTSGIAARTSSSTRSV